MGKTKLIKEEGQLLNVEPEKVPEPEIIEVSYTQAKKMMKKPMSEKQMENAKRLVALNKIKWDQKRKEKKELEQQKQQQIQETTKTIVVKPKRVYPKRTKPVEEIPEESSDDDHEEVYQKPKQKFLTVPKSEKIDQDIEKLKKINETLQAVKQTPSNPYNNMFAKFFKTN